MPQGPAAPIIPMVLVVRGREIADEYSVLLQFFDLLPGTAPTLMLKRIDAMVLDAPTTLSPVLNKEYDFYALLAGNDGSQAYFSHWCVCNLSYLISLSDTMIRHDLEDYVVYNGGQVFEHKHSLLKAIKWMFEQSIKAVTAKTKQERLELEFKNAAQRLRELELDEPLEVRDRSTRVVLFLTLIVS